MKKLRALLVLGCILPALLAGQDLESFPLTDAWVTGIADKSPETPRATPKQQRRVLVFSLHTGYEHWSIPHTEAMLKALLETSGAARCTLSKDISDLQPEKLGQFDAVILNNTCPERDYRDMYYDVYRNDPAMTEAQRRERAAAMEAGFLDYVKAGGGLVLIHGGTTFQNNSMAFSEMSGGSFDFHPPQQPVNVQLAEPGHVLLQAFEGAGFTHTDEPYFFKNAYAGKNFRPLLFMDARELTGLETPVEDPIRYISWIKKYGAGRIFVSAPAHNAQSYENAQLLQFLLDGIQYAIGDLKADDDATAAGN